jgi:hypothetical protein
MANISIRFGSGVGFSSAIADLGRQRLGLPDHRDRHCGYQRACRVAREISRQIERRDRPFSTHSHYCTITGTVIDEV